MTVVHDIARLLQARFGRIQFSIFTVANAVIMFVGDLLQPIAPLVAFLCVAAPVVIVVLALCLLRVGSQHRPIDIQAPAPALAWLSDAAIFVTIGFPLLLATFLWQEMSRDQAQGADVGAFATTFPGLARAQESLGIIEQRLAKVDEKLTSIGVDVRGIREEMGTLKKETSANPRKELNNMGIGWTEQEFIDALMRSDLVALELFLDGGMSPLLNHNGASAVLYALQPRLPDPRPVLELLIRKGFDVNAPLVDANIMYTYGDSMPPHFDTPETPRGYAAWQNTFAGPALLWVVMAATYRMPAEYDLQVIEFLLEHGADRRAVNSFMAAYKPIWGDTTPYQQVAEVLGPRK